MNFQKCLVVANSSQAWDALREYLSQLSFFLPPDVCASILEAQELLRQKSYNLVFLDTHLPNRTEIELIQSFASHIPVIVTSAHPDFAVYGFDLNVVDYLLKPFTFLRFTRAVNRALSVQANPCNQNDYPFIFLKKGHTFQRFDYADIDYVQAYGIYCKIIRQQKVDVVNDTISNLEKILPSQHFLRIHKSYIVNLAIITNYSYRSISVGAHQLSLGAAYRERFEGFLSLLGKKNENED